MSRVTAIAILGWAIAAQPAYSQATHGLPAEPKQLAIACAGVVMAELYRVDEEGQTPIVGKDASVAAARAWVGRATELTGQDGEALMTGPIGAETEKALDLLPATFALKLSWCTRNPPS